jgi:LacI family transcriptional regulator
VRERHYVHTLLDRRVDGIVVTGRRPDPRPPIGDLPVPVVYVYTASARPDDLSVLCDDEQGAALAVNHLLRTGRSHIAHITGPERHLSARLREAGARSALAAAGREFTPGGVLWGEWSEAWGRVAGEILIRSGAPFDAVFCGSDQIARGVADTLRENTYSIPDDVALIGFDNWDVMVDGGRPPLTSIDPNLTELGHVAARKLLSAIEGNPPEHGQIKLPCELVIRQSSAAARPGVGAAPGHRGGKPAEKVVTAPTD